MNFNIFLKEWKRYRLSLAGWSAVLILLIVLTMVFYPTIAENAGQLDSLLKSPVIAGMMEMFAGGADAFSFTDILGFYATKNITFIMLLGSIYSMILASTILSREENEKTADFLLTRPVTRTEVFTAKAGVWLTVILVLNIALTVTGYATLEVLKKDAPLKVKVTAQTRDELITGLRSNSEYIKEVFQPDEKMFAELMSRRLYAEIQTSDKLVKEGLDKEVLEELLPEASQGVEHLLKQIKANPDKYLNMLDIPLWQKSFFLAYVEKAERDYLSSKEGFLHDPAVFIQFFEKDPEYFLQRFSDDPAGLESAIRDFNWNEKTVKDCYYVYEKKRFFTLSFYVFLLMLVFGAIGLFVSTLIKRGRPVSNWGIGLVLAAYVLDAVSKLSPKFDYLGYLSPFKFVSISVLEQGYGLEGWRLAYLILVPLALLAAALWKYSRKDILV